jgi:hypothetical protein
MAALKESSGDVQQIAGIAALRLWIDLGLALKIRARWDLHRRQRRPDRRLQRAVAASRLSARARRDRDFGLRAWSTRRSRLTFSYLAIHQPKRHDRLAGAHESDPPRGVEARSRTWRTWPQSNGKFVWLPCKTMKVRCGNIC